MPGGVDTTVSVPPSTLADCEVALRVNVDPGVIPLVGVMAMLDGCRLGVCKHNMSQGQHLDAQHTAGHAAVVLLESAKGH